MREGSCDYDGRSRSRRWQRWLWSVLVLALAGTCGGPAYAQSPNELESLRQPLEILRSNSSEIVTRSLMQEQLISDLQSEIESLQQYSNDQRRDNERLTALSDEQRADLRTQREALTESQSSHDATSKSWTSYLQLSEAEIRQMARRSRRNRLIWQIGIPVAAAAGVIAGVTLDN